MKKQLVKRIVSLIIVLTTLFSLSVVAFGEETPITVFLDGKQLTFDVNPIIENGRTLVPMRIIFEALGTSVDWNPDTQTAIAVKDGTTIEIAINSTQMLKNGEIVTLDVPARLIDSRTLVPVRAVSEGLGADVHWDDALRQVVITTVKEDTNSKIHFVTPDDNIDLSDTYDFSELSPTDMEKLKSSAATLRYEFEQSYLPGTYLNEPDLIGAHISINSDELINLTYDMWENFLISYIIQLQIDSEDKYVTDTTSSEFSDEYFRSVYVNLINQAGLNARNLFTVSYDKTSTANPLLLITFKNADELLNCKYIAFVVANKTTKCFTCEKTFSSGSDNKYMLCRITTDNRGSYFTVNDYDEFLNGVDELADSNSLPDVSQPR